MSARAPAVAFHDLEPELSDFRRAVWAGLARPQKELPPKFFYDDHGSALFERICALPEYYLTRVELAILECHGAEIVALAGPRPTLAEFGVGSARKIGTLLASFERPSAYIALDIAKRPLLRACHEVATAWPALEVIAVCADYSRPLALPKPKAADGGRRLGAFFGSSIGNFTPLEAVRFLRNLRTTLGPGAALLVGVDLKKDPSVLKAAYDDAQGVTAAFNLNLLARINRELDGDFELARFRHRARYNAVQGRVEMHLECLADHEVCISGHRFALAAGETIHTENSYKYRSAEFQDMAASAGLLPARLFTDPNGLFSLHVLEVP